MLTTNLPEPTLGDILALGPDTALAGCVLLAFIFLLNDLVRTWLMTERTRSVLTHVIVCALTLAPAVVLAAVLVWSALHYPDRALFNLVLAAALYVPWWAGGALTRLVRDDSEGSDLGWLAMGALITFPIGLTAAVLT